MHANLASVLIAQSSVVAPDVPIHDVESVAGWCVNPAVRGDPADLGWQVMVPAGTSWRDWRWFALVHVLPFPMHTGIVIADGRRSYQSGAAPRALVRPRSEAQRAA